MESEVSRADWLAERERVPGVGASQAAALFGLHPGITAFSLFEKLVNPKPPTDEEVEEDADVRSFGLAIEPYLAEWYQRKTGRLVLRPVLPVSRLKDKPYIFASLDREYEHEEHDPEPMTGALELKSAIYFKPEEPLPDYWQVQSQQQMLCRDLRMASFAILGGFRRRYLVNDIPRNDAFCAILVETIDRFMDAVQAGSWDKWGGDVDGEKVTTEALKRLYPKDSGETVTLPAEAERWTWQLAKVKAHLKTLEKRKDQLENLFRLSIGEATQGRLPDGTGWTLRATHNDGHTSVVAPYDYRTLRRVTKQLDKKKG